MRLHDFIKQYSVVSPQACQAFIDVFEESKYHHELRFDEHKHFRELNINQHFPELLGLCSNYVKAVTAKYLAEFPQFYPYFNIKALEEFRIKRYRDQYNAGIEQFRTHVDIGDIHSSKRQLAFLFYLNDDFEGGETEFEHGLIYPKQGDILVFPPTWQYPHAGLPVERGTKYIMSSYLHYT